MELINLTPHAIRLLTQHGDPIMSFPSVGEARLSVARVIAGRVDVLREQDATGARTYESVPVFASSFGELTGLPDRPAPETAYIVSRLVADYAARRPEMAHWPLLVPDFVVRDEAGVIIGCQGFAVACGFEAARAWGLLVVDRYGQDCWGTAIGPEADKLVRSPAKMTIP